MAIAPPVPTVCSVYSSTDTTKTAYSDFLAQSSIENKQELIEGPFSDPLACIYSIDLSFLHISVRIDTHGSD